MRAQALGIGDCDRFLSQVPSGDAAALLGRMDGMVVASHCESFGVVAAEVLMAGVPAVATRCGGAKCIVAEGEGGSVPPWDPEALSGATVDVTETADDVARWANSERARARIVGEAMAGQVTEIYGGAIAQASYAGATTI